MTKPISLKELGLNRTARVVKIDGGRGIVQRLAEMGISSGTELRVVRGKGPIIIEVRRQRLVIGHGMVPRIMVDPIEPATPDDKPIL
ncbi:MAG: FeoA domain-containing protein [Kiritimatiellae bacterium]|nr:FeoA domain-containing protein [Kiritimatiellia bacterium]